MTVQEGNKIIERFMDNECAPGWSSFYHLKWDWLMPVWYKFRDLQINDETKRKLHTNYVARLVQDLAYGTINEFHHNITIALTWYNSQNL